MPIETDQKPRRSGAHEGAGLSALDRPWLPWMVIFAGVAQLTLLLATVRPGAFFSGDGGMKFLMVRQFVEGRLFPRLELPDPAGLAGLWESGLYPFVPPFAYAQADGWVAGFPMPFPILSAPFYALFGQWGLYVLPAISILAVWLLSERTLARMGVGALIRSIVLAALIFASPLTIYGATFWEHAPAVWMVSASLMLLGLGSSHVPRRSVLVAAGLLVGFSVWLRPEALVAVALLGGATLHLRGRGATRDFALGALAAGLGLLGWNIAWYGSPLGIHAVQVVASPLGGLETVPFGSRLGQMIADGATAYPFGAIGLVGLLAAGRSSRGVTAGLYALATLAGILAIAAIVPNAGGAQWGPRYLLPLVPLLTVSAAVALSSLTSAALALRVVGAVGVAAALAAGIQQNTIGAVEGLDYVYGRRVGDALVAVEERPERVVLSGNRYIPQEFASLTDRKGFLRLPGSGQLPQLMRQLQEIGHDRALLLVSNESWDSESRASVRAMRAWIRPIGRVGSHDLYSVLTAGAGGAVSRNPKGQGD